MTKMPNIARKFESGVGFSNGCALLALKKPPPLVPNCLMISCDATGPCAMVCAARLRPSCTGVVRLAGSGRRPARRGTSAPTMADRQQHPERRARHVDPEVADGLLLLLRDAADERDRHRDAGRRRHEVVIREPGHLREVAHGRLAAVRLPVRVGRERRGGVEGECRARRRRIPAGCSGSTPCSRCIAYSTSIETTLNSEQRDRRTRSSASRASRRRRSAGRSAARPAAAPDRATCAGA